GRVGPARRTGVIRARRVATAREALVAAGGRLHAPVELAVAVEAAVDVGVAGLRAPQAVAGAFAAIGVRRARIADSRGRSRRCRSTGFLSVVELGATAAVAIGVHYARVRAHRAARVAHAKASAALVIAAFT